MRVQKPAPGGRGGGPCDALASVVGRATLCWERAWRACGRPALLGPTVTEPQPVPRALGAEEPLTGVARPQGSVPTTGGGGCVLGGSGGGLFPRSRGWCACSTSAPFCKVTRLNNPTCRVGCAILASVSYVYSDTFT